MCVWWGRHISNWPQTEMNHFNERICCCFLFNYVGSWTPIRFDWILISLNHMISINVIMCGHLCLSSAYISAPCKLHTLQGLVFLYSLLMRCISFHFLGCNRILPSLNSYLLWTWQSPTENCPNSGICRRISSVTRWTPRCCGLRLIFRWNHADPIWIPRFEEAMLVCVFLAYNSPIARNQDQPQNTSTKEEKKIEPKKITLTMPHRHTHKRKHLHTWTHLKIATKFV